MNNLKGLSTEEAKRKLEENGKNCLQEEKKKTIIEMFLKQLLTLTTLVLGIAIGISIFTKEYSETIILVFVILLNATIACIYESQAQKTLDALKKLSVPKAIVYRDGEKKEISAEELVIDDIVVLEAGRQVPADLKLLETATLKIDESILTGETVPIEKDETFNSDKNGENKKISIGDRLDLGKMSEILDNSIFEMKAKKCFNNKTIC